MYQVPEYIDKNKIFIVQRSMIDGRLDPHYNKPDYRELYGTLSKIPCNISTLKKESYSIFSGITPKSGGDAYSKEPGSIPFVRSGDFSETNQIDFSTLLYLKPEVHNGVMHSSQLKKNDLLIAIVGATIGKVGIYQYDREANINQAICGVRLKDYINPLYVQAFYQTGIGQKIIDRIKRPVARANLNLEEIGNLPIPMVDGRTQGIIVAKLQEGINLRLQKESEAQRILNSIDTYLLEELGITLPETRTDLDSRMFLVNFSDVTGCRLDAEYRIYNLDYKSIKYDSITLGRIANFCKGTALTSKDIISGDIPVVAGGKTSPYSHNKANFNGNVITVSASGAYAGYVWYHKHPIFATDCSVIWSKDERAFSTKYLYEVLRTLQPVIYRLQVGAAQPHVYPSDLMNISIPVISSEGQELLVDFAERLRQQAQTLQSEGKAILENAKREVEKMIIGE